jgi:hypothetical protein
MNIVLCPYQIKARQGKMWLENVETGAEYFHGDATPSWRRMLEGQRNKMNSRVGLDRCGV